MIRSVGLRLLSLLWKGIHSTPIIETTLPPVIPPNDDDDNNGSCKLMDGFAIFIQISLCFTALLVLVYKRSTESPQRPYQIWALDVSKQFIGAGMIHFINLGISYAASQPINGGQPPTNLCTWYFLNVAIDTTLGVFILWCWYNVISATLDLFNIKDGLTTGDYGPPPLINMLKPWLRQITIFLLAELLAKSCLYILLINSPWLFWLGEKCLAWTEGDERSQVVFVIFPLIMNAFQFWLTDTIIKLHELMPTKEPKLPATPTVYATVFVEQTERTPLLFPPSKHRTMPT